MERCRRFSSCLAAAITGDLRALARYLVKEAPRNGERPCEDDYLDYNFNRFQASRLGVNGVIVDPRSGEQITLRDGLIATLARIESHAIDTLAEDACRQLLRFVHAGETDADWLREAYAREESFAELVRLQCARWQQGGSAL
jgi:carboxylate-amine ligase